MFCTTSSCGARNVEFADAVDVLLSEASRVALVTDVVAALVELEIVDAERTDPSAF
jgi:hypothetical protein